SCAKAVNIELKEGVYYYMTGPCYETASEVKAINRLGANAVGMSTAPEVIVAAHGGMKIMGLSCITNMATGIRDQHIDHDGVMKMGNQVEKKFMTLLKSILREWSIL
ncbi:MAG: purine-nucleoside phosphorylase, partial [Desulfobacteraceae bacterium]|nr:purine-nucleoside phosphorylase [Desulfobacteraceae bacterium]